MNINLFPLTVLWMFLAVVVVGLIFYRMWIAKDEDDRLHVMDSEAGLVAQQAGMAEKLETIDHWGQTLSVITLVYGIAMGSLYLYQVWAASEHLLRYVETPAATTIVRLEREKACYRYTE